MFGRALLASGLLAVFAASFPTEHVPLSSSPAAPPGPWRAVDGAVDASHEMVFLVALPHRNAHELESTFWEVSDPNHERYGRHLSRDEVADAFGPAEEHKAAVAFWLASAGLSFEPTAAGDWFVVRAPAAAVEALFATQLARFEHQATGRRVVRAALPLLVPSFVAPAIDLIHGVADFPDPRASFSLSVGHAPPRGAAERAATLLRRAAHPSLPEPEAQFMGQGNHELVLSVVPYCAGPKGVEACPDMAALRGNITAFSARVVFAGNGSLVTESESPLSALSCNDYYGVAQCQLVVSGLTNFVSFNVSVASRFKDGGALSPFADAGASAYTSPFVLPATIRSLYGASHAVAKDSRSTAGVALWEYQFFSPSDEDAFVSNTSASGHVPPPRVVAPTDANQPSQPADEGQMDVELESTTAEGAQTTFWYASNDEKGLLMWALQVANATDPPLVFSISWGLPEAQIASNYGPNFAPRLAQELMKMGVRGISVVFASGDAGASGIGRTAEDCSALQPSFPASTPYVLAVSATMLLSASGGSREHLLGGAALRGGTAPSAAPGTHVLPASDPALCSRLLYGRNFSCDVPSEPVREVAVSCCGPSAGAFWTTGGGFSNMYARPAFQNAAVQAYLNDPAIKPSLPPLSVGFNASGRAYPDVSAIGQNVLVLVGGELQISGGTSASSPIVAGLLALLNDVRLQAGRPPLGAVAPLLYQLWAKQPAAFNDILVGSNACGEFACCPHGFQAYVGWDAVTGLGTLNVDVLSKLV